MPEFKLVYIRLRGYIYFLMAAYVLLWGFTAHKAVFLGLILGTATSHFNLWLLLKRVDRFSQAVDAGRSIRSLGTVSRMAAAVLAVLIAVKFPQYFNVYCVVIGLMTSFVVIMIDFFVQTFILRKSQKK